MAESIRLGNPLDADTEMGPLTSKTHLERVLGYIDACKRDGNAVLSGGAQPDEAELKKGCYLKPTVVEAQPGDTVFQEEVFGPFVSVTRFKDDAEALALANATAYGLGSGLWTNNLQRAHRCADGLRAGMVWVNATSGCIPPRLLGAWARPATAGTWALECLHEYTAPKAIWINYDANLPPFYSR